MDLSPYRLDVNSVINQATVEKAALKQARRLITCADDSAHNATLHSLPRLSIYGLSIGRSNCVIYVTCKYTNSCCRQQMAGWGAGYSSAEGMWRQGGQQVILARPESHNGAQPLRLYRSLFGA
jgi:hypothetical protein